MSEAQSGDYSPKLPSIITESPAQSGSSCLD
jgi:hypothetical protein